MLGDCTKETREIARRAASGDECGERGVGVGVCRSIHDLRRRVGAALQEEEPTCECVRARARMRDGEEKRVVVAFRQDPPRRLHGSEGRRTQDGHAGS